MCMCVCVCVCWGRGLDEVEEGGGWLLYPADTAAQLSETCLGYRPHRGKCVLGRGSGEGGRVGGGDGGEGAGREEGWGGGGVLYHADKTAQLSETHLRYRPHRGKCVCV